MNNKLIAYYLKYETSFISSLFVCVCGGKGGGEHGGGRGLVVTHCTEQVVTSVNSLIL